MIFYRILTQLNILFYKNGIFSILGNKKIKSRNKNNFILKIKNKIYKIEKKSILRK